METSQIYIFFSSIILGLIAYIYVHKFTLQNNITTYLIILFSCIGASVLYSFIYATLSNNNTVDAILGIGYHTYTGRKAAIGLVIINSGIVLGFLSIISDILYLLLKPIIDKVKEHKQKEKFRTPKIK